MHHASRHVYARLRRVGRSLRRLFGRRPRATPGAAMSPQRQYCMHRQLSQLLGRHPRARAIFRHLAAVEHVLRRKGASAIAELPPVVLRKAQEQLLTLVDDGSALGLSDLRTTLQSALARHPRQPTPAREVPAAPRGDGHGLQVQEVSSSMFMEADRGWSHTIPGAVA
jgi:hypothetical protein